MAIDDRMDELLERWEEQKRNGQCISVEELCRERPDLREELRARIAALERMEGVLGVSENGQPAATGQRPRTRLDDLVASAEPIPGYRLEQRLGQGGFGEVWKATGPGGFAVALKFVSLAEKTGPAELHALEVIKDIHHPNLLATFGAWQKNGFLVIAMELAERTLLDRFLEATQQGLAGIPRAELLDYFTDAARGIDFLNTARQKLEGQDSVGIQHRDIKPQNLLLVGGCVKVADFGLARFLRHTVTGHSGSMTIAYAAPEFFDGRTHRHSDQYSLAVAYCILRGGRLPFEGSAFHIMAGHLHRPPELAMLPVEERPVVARALAKDPAGRWPNCRAFVNALRNCQKEPQRRWRRLASYLIAISASIGVGLAFWALPTQRPIEVIAPPTSQGTGAAKATVIFERQPRTTPSKATIPSTKGEPVRPPPDVLPPTTSKATIPLPSHALVFFKPGQDAGAAQQQVATQLGRQVHLKNKIGMDLVLIPPGEFWMGSPETDPERGGEELRHRVVISRAFYLGRYEVTQREFESVMEHNPARFRTPTRPVEQVSWQDAVVFCEKLTRLDGARYRLPSEAEWEYACRAGTTTPFPWGETYKRGLVNVHGTNVKGPMGTQPVGSYPPNAFGLFDMIGNVSEWCTDWYEAGYYARSPLTDPTGPEAGTHRVLRGANWFDGPGTKAHGSLRCRSAYRIHEPPDRRFNRFGFRVVQEVE